jgi:beta-lactamase class A
MNKGRRIFLSSAAGLSLASGNAALAEDSEEENYAQAGSHYALKQDIEDMFDVLSDRTAFKIWAPKTRNAPEFLVQHRPGQRMFIASSFKALVLCERLRQLDSANIEEKLADHDVTLDKSVWSPGSPIFNPPSLSGIVSERTAMEAMVIHSDNTATDMVMKEAGVAKVRSFISSIGMNNTTIPESTRSFAGYLFGAPNYKTITWDELLAIAGQPVNSFLNDVETLASTPNDLVSFYSRALDGKFFTHPETLSEFRRILALGDIAHIVPFDLGANVFGKAGYSDFPGFHARSIAGAVYFPKRWVYFSMAINWTAQEPNDPKTVDTFFSAIRNSIALVQKRLAK